MHRWIALLRGVNVGGKHILPMAQLRELLQDLGLGQARTYIQSGNCFFTSPRKLSAAAIAKQIDREIQTRLGFPAPTLVFPTSTLTQVVDANPFPDADPKRLQIFFPWQRLIEPTHDRIAQLAKPSEAFHLSPRAFYLYAPDGIARSKLATKVDQLLGVTCTARNLNTCNKLLALAETNSDA